MVDQVKLDAFTDKMPGDLGGALGAPSVRSMSLGQPVNLALSGQGGVARLSGQGVFTRVRKAAGTPFDMVIEARA